MRERDMRLRVQRFLQSRLRSMLMPATMGLGLAVGGCASDGLSADDGGDKKDVAADVGPTTKYMAQLPDAAPDLQVVPLYSVVVPRDAGPELPAAQPDYMAQMPDSGTAIRYAALMPDAGRDLGESVAIYIAQIPDPRT
jgi:hypothetical protein